MKSKVLLTSLNEVNDEYVEDADVAVASVKRFGWIKWAAVAACLLIAVLIAVPALKGKAPEVEPEPSEPTPIEEPVDEPAESPVDEPVDEPASDDGKEPDTNIVPMGGGVDEPTGDRTYPGPVATMTFPHYFTSYEDFSTFVEDPVYEAFLNSDEGQKHDVVFSIGNYGSNAFFTTRSMDDLYSTSMILDPIEVGSTYEIYSLDLYENSDYLIAEDLDEYQQTTWSADSSSVTISHDYQELTVEFENAEKYGVLTTYEVNGVEIQTFDGAEFNVKTLEEAVVQNPDNPSYNALLERAQEGLAEEHLHYARVDINGVWYEVSGYNEANVTTIAEALARIAG